MESMDKVVGDIKAGIYRHKGKLYLFDKIIRLHTNFEYQTTNGDPVRLNGSIWITYIPLWIDPKYTGPRTSAREFEDFFENFEYVGPAYEGQEVSSGPVECG